jgi:hypothetical protein
MRHVLRLLGNRYGIALTLVVVVAVVVVSAKLLGYGSSNANTRSPDDTGPAVTTTVSAEPDDGLDEPSGPPPGPSTSPGAAGPETVAVDFAKAWLNHTGISAANWHAALSRYATRTLADQLADTDPAGVPASRITGKPNVVNHTESLVDVAIPLDAGTVSLRVVATDGRWLVDGVDYWGPSAEPS